MWECQSNKRNVVRTNRPHTLKVQNNGLILKQECESHSHNPFFPSRRVYAKFHPQSKTSTFCSSYQRAAKPATGIIFNITTPRLITAPATGGPATLLTLYECALIWQAGPRSPVLTTRDSCQFFVSLLIWHKYPLSLTLVNYPGGKREDLGKSLGTSSRDILEWVWVWSTKCEQW